jgi:hypothetical protein
LPRWKPTRPRPATRTTPPASSGSTESRGEGAWEEEINPMGVTIHFEGRLKHPKAYPLLLDALQEYATKNNWPVVQIPEEHRTLRRVRDEKDWDYSGLTFGLELQPSENADPLRFEFDKDYFVQEFIKTQFAGPELHIEVINLFRLIQPYFDKLDICDEGDFWETSDAKLLVEHIENCDRALQKMLAENPKAKGPVRLPTGRIVDYMS